MKLTHILVITSALAASSVSAATIAYTFETPGNITNANGVNEAYSGPDTNTFGSGITFSEFTLADRDATNYSRFVNLGGSSVEAAVGDGASALVATFTITIDSSVVVDLTNITFDQSYRNTFNSATAVDWGFSTTLGADPAGNVSSNSWTHTKAGIEYQSPGGNASGDIDLSGLTNLTNTSVTFSWELNAASSHTFANRAIGLDDIVITGSSVAVPEPSSTALLGLGGLALILRRRR